MKASELTGLIVAFGFVAIFFLLGVVQQPRRASRPPCVNNLKQIAFAMHNYHGQHGTFPPAYTADENGIPLHSWRVLILPYLGEQELYQEIRLDEPWDSLHNRALQDRIPEQYRCPNFSEYQQKTTHGSLGDRWLTSYTIVNGPATVFNGIHTTALSEITDGTSNTILVAEVCQGAVHWMRPYDVTAEEWLAELLHAHEEDYGQHRGGFYAALADGRARFLPSTIDGEVLKSLITKNGGEAIPEW